MFNLEEYKKFVLEQVVTTDIVYKKVNIADNLLNALYQFEVAPSVYLSELHKDVISKGYKKMFGNLDKPSNVQFNSLFIHKFNYKRCLKCKNILLLDNFYTSNHNWDSKGSICISCTSLNYKKETIAKTKRNYKPNRYKVNEATTKYYVNKFLATPKWLTIEQLAQIESVYILATNLEKQTGVKYHVDHIIPLQGKDVCGLHVPWNLQAIPATQNLQKGSRRI